MTSAYLVIGVLSAGAVAYLVRDYSPVFLVTAALTWLFAMMQAFLGNIGCRYSYTLQIHNPIEQALYAAPLAVVTGVVALLFAYALKMHRRAV